MQGLRFTTGHEPVESHDDDDEQLHLPREAYEGDDDEDVDEHLPEAWPGARNTASAAELDADDAEHEKNRPQLLSLRQRMASRSVAPAVVAAVPATPASVWPACRVHTLIVACAVLYAGWRACSARVDPGRVHVHADSEDRLYRWNLLHLSSGLVFAVYHRHAHGRAEEHVTRTEAWQNGRLAYVLRHAHADAATAPRDALFWGERHCARVTSPMPPVTWHARELEQMGSEWSFSEQEAPPVLSADELLPPCENAPVPVVWADAVDHDAPKAVEFEHRLLRDAHAAMWQTDVNLSAVDSLFYRSALRVDTQRYVAVGEGERGPLLFHARSLAPLWTNCNLSFPLGKRVCPRVQECARLSQPLSCDCLQHAVATTLHVDQLRCGACVSGNESAACQCWAQWRLVRALVLRQPCAVRLECTTAPLPLLCPPLRLCVAQFRVPCDVMVDGWNASLARDALARRIWTL